MDKKKIKLLGNFHKGRGLDKSKLTNVGMPCILYGEIYSKYNIKFNKASSFTNRENEKNSNSL